MKPFFVGVAFGVAILVAALLIIPWLAKFYEWYGPWVENF